jgi:hypothetical protein
MLAGLVAALPADMAAASATASRSDSHLVELGRQRLALKKSLADRPGDFTDEHLDNLTDQLWAVEDAIVEAKANSSTGLLVKLDSAQGGISDQLEGSGAPEPAFADLCQTIRTLARIGSTQA